MSELFRARFSDSDNFSAAIANWNLEFRQIDRGPLVAVVDRAMCPDLVVHRVQLSRRFHQRGFAPQGLRTFGIPELAGKLSWNDRSAQQNSLMNFNRRNGFDAVSETGFAADTISISSDVFRCDAVALGLPALADDLEDMPEQFIVNNADLERIRFVISGLFDVLGNAEIAHKAVTVLQEDLKLLLIRSLENPFEPTDRTGHACRQRAVDRALEFILSTTDAIAVSRVCEYSGVSYRTLNRGFKDRFQINPKQYIVATRLAGLRRALMTAHCEIRISDIASDWGFWNLGRLASDYRRMFGELPSTTLRRRRREIGLSFSNPIAAGNKTSR